MKRVEGGKGKREGRKKNEEEVGRKGHEDTRASTTGGNNGD